VVAGRFTAVDGVPVTRLARWNGTSWSPAAPWPFTGATAPIQALAVLPSGDLLVGGSFANVAGIGASNLARWDGTNWSALGGSPGGSIEAILTLPNGDVVVGGNFSGIGSVAASGVARWDGTQWQAVGSEPDAQVLSLVADGQGGGGFFAGGLFQFSSGPRQVAHWTGSAWQPLGAGFDNAVEALLRHPNGDLFAAGRFVFSGGSVMNRIARWDGTAWSAFGNGVADIVDALALTPDGGVMLGGRFFVAGSDVAVGQARLLPTCPAATVVVGGGCQAGGGLLQLAATSRPWLGGNFTAECTGFGAGAVLLQLVGAVPLAVPLPGAATNCLVLVEPWTIGVVVPGGLAADVTLALPDVPSAVGLVLREQVVALELQSGAIAQLATSNALAMVLGDF
jgi:hypothetical protein